MAGIEGLLREMMIVCGVLCVPMLAVAAIVGTAVAIVQAATQVQEQTLTLLPKAIAVGACVALCGPLAMHLCARLFNDAIRTIPALVGGL